MICHQSAAPHARPKDHALLIPDYRVIVIAQPLLNEHNKIIKYL